MKQQFYLNENGAIVQPKWKKRLSVFNKILSFLMMAICLCFLSFSISHSMKIVEGQSMQPTINQNYVKNSHYDIVLYNKFQQAKRGDIVIVNRKEQDTQHPFVIKRLIAKEGDKLNIEWNETDQKLVVTLNDKVLDEPYTLKDSTDTTKDHKNSKNCANNFNKYKSSWEVEILEDGSIVIPKGCVFVLGDNRGGSVDCSEYGPIKESTLEGVVDTLIADGSFLNSALKFLFSLN